MVYWWIHLGLGRHASSILYEHLLLAPKIRFTMAFLYDVSISLPKFSALFFYYRIFRRTHRWFYFSLWVLGSMTVAWLLAAWLSNIFQCWPVTKEWSPLEEGHCFSRWKWFLGTAIPSMIIDLIILIIPLPLLWSLHASPNRRLLITGVFLCGYWQVGPSALPIYNHGNSVRLTKVNKVCQ